MTASSNLDWRVHETSAGIANKVLLQASGQKPAEADK